MSPMSSGRTGKKSSEPKAVQISKQLTQLLRHSGRSQGLKVRSDGFTSLDDVLKLPSMMKLGAKLDIVREIVQTSDKQRLALQEENGLLLIRANQGHSMDGIVMDELCGSPVRSLNPGEVCCHGTYERHLASIMTHGLKAGGKMGLAYRKDVHFSVRHPGQNVISGMRQNCQIAVYVDLERAARNGLLFYRSANDVILSAGINGTIPPEYIESIWDIKKKSQIYPRGGSKEVAEDVAHKAETDEADEAAGVDEDSDDAADAKVPDELDKAVFYYRVFGCAQLGL